MKLTSLVEDARRYVVGYYDDDGEQFVHWTEEDWASYVRLSVGVVAMSDEQLFTTEVDVPLVAGELQQLPPCCRSLSVVRGQRDEHGRIMAILRKRSLRSLSLPAIRRKTCAPTALDVENYKMTSYSVNPDDPTIFMVDPPVPEGVNAVVSVMCHTPPVMMSLEDDIPLDDTHKAIVFELMLYYAWGVDIEDVANRERSNKHWDNALALMKIKDATMKSRIFKAAGKVGQYGTS